MNNYNNYLDTLMQNYPLQNDSSDDEDTFIKKKIKHSATFDNKSIQSGGIRPKKTPTKSSKKKSSKKNTKSAKKNTKNSTKSSKKNTKNSTKSAKKNTKNSTKSSKKSSTDNATMARKAYYLNRNIPNDNGELNKLESQEGYDTGDVPFGGFPPIFLYKTDVKVEDNKKEREYNKHKTSVSIKDIMQKRRNIQPFITI
jgi:hypothetical protein